MSIVVPRRISWIEFFLFLRFFLPTFDRVLLQQSGFAGTVELLRFLAPAAGASNFAGLKN